MNVCILGLSTGEQLLAEVIETISPESKITIKKPLLIMFGHQGVQFAPWLFGMAQTDEPVSLSESSVLYCLPAVKAVHDQYLQATTGLVIPDPAQSLKITTE